MPSQQDHRISPRITLELDDLEDVVEIRWTGRLDQEPVKKRMQSRQAMSKPMFDPGVDIDPKGHEDGSATTPEFSERGFVVAVERFTQRSQ